MMLVPKIFTMNPDSFKQNIYDEKGKKRKEFVYG